MRLPRGRLLFGGAVILALAILPVTPGGTGICAQPHDGWLPYAPAPDGQWGAGFSGEYDRRDAAGGGEVEVRRFLFRIGGTPVSFGTFWAEAGIAALTLMDGNKVLQGDFGTAAGAGASLAWPGSMILKCTPFTSGRANIFLSRLEDDCEISTNVSQSRRSRFEWVEYSGMAGLARPFGPGRLYGAVAARSLIQVETRSMRSNTSRNNDVRKFEYRSGLKVGLAATYAVPMKSRFNMWTSAEVYQDSWKITLAAGQWGTP